MRAVYTDSYGGPEVLSLREMPEPSPKAGEIKVRVRAASVNSADSRIRSRNVPAGMGLIMGAMLGFRRPRHRIPGTCFAGKVVAVGAGVRRFAPCDRVFGSTGMAFGAWADFLCIPETGAIARMPDDLSMDAAASVPFGGMTALDFLRAKGRLMAGERLLVIGASGAVGSMAVQIGRHLGAEVDAVISGRNEEIAAALGARRTIDYHMRDFRSMEERWDVIMDTVGAVDPETCADSLTENGRFLMLVGGVPDYLKIALHRVTKGPKVIGGVAAESRESMETLSDMLEEGTLRPVVGSVHPVEEIRAVNQLVDKGHKIGAAVVSLGDKVDSRI